MAVSCYGSAINLVLTGLLISFALATFFPPPDNKWFLIKEAKRRDQLYAKWKTAFDWFCSPRNHFSELIIEGVLSCDKNHLNKRLAKKCANEVYGEVKLFKARRLVQCNETANREFDGKFYECYFKASPQYARDYLDSYNFYNSQDDKGKIRVRTELARKKNQQASWNVDCLNKIKEINEKLWYNHERIALRFCDPNITSTSELHNIHDCTLLGYDSTIYNEKRMNCISQAFGSNFQDHEKRRTVLCEKKARMDVHLKFAVCYYGVGSEEAAEESDPSLNADSNGTSVSTDIVNPGDVGDLANQQVKEENGTFVLSRLPDSDNAVILDLHKDFDGFYLELECMLRAMGLTMIRKQAAEPPKPVESSD